MIQMVYNIYIGGIKMNKKNNYCDNNKLDKCITVYNYNLEKNSLEYKEASDYIGEMIMSIAERLSRRGNFRNYIFRDELIECAISDMCAALSKYDPNKSKNAFSYLTTIAFNSFLNHIKSEKHQLYTKFKQIESSIIDSQGNSELSEIAIACDQYCNKETDDYFREFIQNFEESRNRTRDKYKNIYKNKRRTLFDILKR